MQQYVQVIDCIGVKLLELNIIFMVQGTAVDQETPCMANVIVLNLLPNDGSMPLPRPLPSDQATPLISDWVVNMKFYLR